MPDVSRETGLWIDARRRELAEAVVARQYELRPALRERYGEGGRAKCAQDTEYHLAYLAAAVTYSSPALFCDYIAWAKAVLAAYGVGPEDVDDNLACLRDVLSEQLPGGTGEAVAHDGPGALRAAEAQRPDVALLDIGLPGMDGYELARRLRQEPALGRPVLVALTGWGQEEDRRRSQEAGFDHHLVKPVELEDLQQLLAQARPHGSS